MPSTPWWWRARAGPARARDIQALCWAAIAVQVGIPEHIPPVPNIRSQAARRAGAYEEAIQHLLVLIPPPQRDEGTVRAIRQVHDALGAPRLRWSEFWKRYGPPDVGD